MKLSVPIFSTTLSIFVRFMEIITRLQWIPKIWIWLIIFCFMKKKFVLGLLDHEVFFGLRMRSLIWLSLQVLDVWYTWMKRRYILTNFFTILCRFQFCVNNSLIQPLQYFIFLFQYKVQFLVSFLFCIMLLSWMKQFHKVY